MRTRGSIRLSGVSALAVALPGSVTASTVAQEEVKFVYRATCDIEPCGPPRVLT